jgi:2-polyprenyl-3-methyl-5-hydroxy-6-metoxy-1,4-benzoquinol methylase
MHTAFVYRPHCELCGSSQTQSLLKKSFTDPAVWDFLTHYYQGRIEKELLVGASYEISKCLRCGFIWQASILNDDLMSKLYDTWIAADGSLKKKRAAEVPLGYLRQAELIGRLLPDKAPANLHVLDFGMGWGYWCMAARTAGYHAVGLEISEKRLQFAREQGVEVVKQLSELRDQNFDFINADQVFEHIPQPLQTLKLLVAHLNPGGIVRIAVPDGQGIEHELARPDWRASKNSIHPLEHINCFQHKTLIHLGEYAGLSVVSQPALLTMRHGWQALARGVVARYYRRFFGTVLYFRYSNSTPEPV